MRSDFCLELDLLLYTKFCMEMYTLKALATQATPVKPANGLRRNAFHCVHFHALFGVQKQLEFKAEIAAH